MIDLKALKDNKEAIAAKVHDAWWDEKENQGFHSPINCFSIDAEVAHNIVEISSGEHQFPKFRKFCDKCHTDMYPYPDLPEHVKDYDRVTVDAVIKAIEDLDI